MDEGPVDPLARVRTALDRAVLDLRGAHVGPGSRPTPAPAPSSSAPSSAPARSSSPAPSLERPKRAGQGDFATNAAMLLAPVLGEPPRVIAERLGRALTLELGDALAEVTVAGPGFVNLTMSDRWCRDVLARILAAGPAFGADGAAVPERILLEFVSANPTAELVAASGRHAAYGDSLARILIHHGHTVSREYYFNDAGSQIRRLGESVRARALGQPVPTDGYQGDYVAELAEQIDGAADPEVDVEVVAARTVEILLARITATLIRFGVQFDTFFSERALHEGDPSPLEQAVARLEEAGHVYRHEGATWLRTTTFGDDRDRVLIRSDGQPTYFAADVAYMANKRERGYERQLLPVGADHHGYVARLHAAFAGLGNDPERLEVVIMQLVHLVEDGEKAKMSKRRGEFVTLDELMDEIGVDATRYFMLQSSHDRTLDLNLDLARSQSSENPVYYIQYAHARICSVLEKAGVGRDSSFPPRAWDGAEDSVELHRSERELVLKLADFPADLATAADRRAPHRIAGYALELAQAFTAFYRDCPILGAEPETADAVRAFRLALCLGTRGVLELVLGLLGVSAPESM